MNARIQHNLTHGIIYAGTPDADPAYPNSLYSVVQTMEKLSESSPGKIVGLSSYWNGIKSEIAVVRTFIKNGYQVMLPDYSQDTFDINQEQNEVLQWDVRNGIDFLAKKDDHLFLVDAKGRWSMEGKYIRTIPHVNHQRVTVRNIPKDILASYADLFRKERVGKIEVRIPILNPFLTGLPNISDSTNKRKALSQFANSQVEDDIMTRVKQEIDKMPK